MSSRTETTFNAVRPARILVVEDESLVAIDLERRLTRLGYEVCGRADTAEGAIAQALALQPELVLMDIHLIGPSDGMQAAETIRQKNGPPVVFLTADADDRTLQRIRHAEPYGFILKPFDERELKASIETALSRRQAEQHTQQMERWLSMTLSSIGDGVIACDQHQRITFINRAAQELTGWPSNTAYGQPLDDVYSIENSPPPVNGERQLRRKDQRLVPLEETINPIRDDRDQNAGCVIVFRDASVRKNHEQARQRLEQKMHETHRFESLGVLASGIAHDFNNILQAILGNATLGRDLADGSDEITECFSEIEKSSQHGGQLCKQLLLYAGKSQLRVETLDLSQFVQESEPLLRLGLSRDCTLAFDLSSRLPSMLGDRSQLQEVLINLVLNAAESIGPERGTITLRTGLFRASPEHLAQAHGALQLPAGEYLMLEICDTGRAVPPETRRRIFDPFFSKSSARGLSLASVLGIIRSHGGCISVESDATCGNCFRLLLPGLTGSERALPARPLKLAWRASGPILLADDELPNRLSGRAMLRHLGFTPIQAENGQQAVDLVHTRQGEFRAVLLDLTMPVLDGAGAARAIRRRYPTLPILIMTGYSDDQTRQLFADFEFIDFVQKPFSLSNLVEKLSGLLEPDDA